MELERHGNHLEKPCMQVKHLSPAGAASVAALLALFLVCAFAGARGEALDQSVAAWAAELRSGSPQILHWALALTDLGAAPFTLGLGAAGALFLAFRKRYTQAAILIAAIIVERLAVDGLKLLFGRVRPDFDQEMIEVYNLSFPSGHSANSLTAYVLLACFLVTGRFRAAAILGALAIAFVIGLTRIVLGVHWLSDVVGGWAVGLIAVILSLAVHRRLRANEQ